MTKFFKTRRLPFSFLIMLCAASAAANSAFANETLTIENFIGTINIETSEGAPLRIIKSQNGDTVTVSESSGRLILDGGVAKPDGKDCEGHYGRYNVSFFSKKEKSGQFGGYKNLETYPVITVSAPDDVDVFIKNSIPFMTIGDMGALNATLNSCGNLDFGNLSGEARISIMGSADFTLDDIQNLDLTIKGSGDVKAGNAGIVTIDLKGSGDVDLQDITAVDIKSVGSGDVEIGQIRGPLVYVGHGSGDFEAVEILEGLVYEGRGSGDFSAESVTGDVSIQSRGSSSVDIGDGSIGKLLVTTRGSGEVDIDAIVESAELFASGSGDISVKRVNGNVSMREAGSADIRVENR